MKKLNIFAFVLVFSFSGLFANPASAVVTTNNTFWNGSELVPIDWGGYGSSNNNNNNNNNSNNNYDDVSTMSATNIDEDSAKLRGEVINGDNVRVWFVIDDNDSTPSCSDDDIEYSVSGTYDDGDEFSRTVSGLRSDRTYYFRACTNDNSGSIRSFRTDDDNYNDNSNNNNNNNSNNSADDLVALTTNASGVTTNSAILNGLSIINRGNSGNAWFEYGTTTSLGSRTPNQSIGTGNSNISRQISNLAPRTSYYFRLVIQNNEGTDYGDIKAVTTNGVATTNTNTTSTNTNTTTTNTTSTYVSSSNLLGLNIEANLDSVSVGDIVTYTVSYKNVSGKELKNVVMKIDLPKEVNLRKTTLGEYSDSTHSIVISILGIPKDVKGQFTVITEVNKLAKETPVLIASVEGVYDNPSNEEVKGNSIAFSVVDVDDSNSNLTAGSLNSGKFFPTSLIGWLLIIFIIFLIVIIARKMAKDKEEREEETQEIKIS